MVSLFLQPSLIFSSVFFVSFTYLSHAFISAAILALETWPRNHTADTKAHHKERTNTWDIHSYSPYFNVISLLISRNSYYLTLFCSKILEFCECNHKIWFFIILFVLGLIIICILYCHEDGEGTSQKNTESKCLNLRTISSKFLKKTPK